MAVASHQKLVERVWARDPTVWTDSGEEKWLGWLDEPKRMQERLDELYVFTDEGTGINEERVRQAAETGAGTLAVACPFCTVMLDDGVRNTGAKLQVIDLASLLHEAVERKSSTQS